MSIESDMFEALEEEINNAGQCAECGETHFLDDLETCSVCRNLFCHEHIQDGICDKCNSEVIQ